ncbi:hypothetical protein [Polyangium jinanense]|uniref:DUF4177 domain-containing protein n=1 Tax=Polyangium jinanense TaxID=2829994 RepID=A0A9X3X7S2_9BACT|nr:hypothetical protein [Polyangium jinanense]MDC3956078.1 DUF4177 domain-containing protein [Polyangium jinanense]MDC3982891.1 DUF4177 domain-containing protein [Polyangium jinanense]
MSSRWRHQISELKPSLIGNFKPEAMQEELNRQGNLGWELVQLIVPAPIAPAMLVFKIAQ